MNIFERFVSTRIIKTWIIWSFRFVCHGGEKERRREGEKENFWKWEGIKISSFPRRKEEKRPPPHASMVHLRTGELYFAIERTRFVKNRAARAKEALDENTLQRTISDTLFLLRHLRPSHAGWNQCWITFSKSGCYSKIRWIVSRTIDRT